MRCLRLSPLRSDSRDTGCEPEGQQVVNTPHLTREVVPPRLGHARPALRGTPGQATRFTTSEQQAVSRICTRAVSRRRKSARGNSQPAGSQWPYTSTLYWGYVIKGSYRERTSSEAAGISAAMSKANLGQASRVRVWGMGPRVEG